MIMSYIVKSPSRLLESTTTALAQQPAGFEVALEHGQEERSEREPRPRPRWEQYLRCFIQYHGLCPDSHQVKKHPCQLHR
jgi:hypothetical protein